MSTFALSSRRLILKPTVLNRGAWVLAGILALTSIGIAAPKPTTAASKLPAGSRKHVYEIRILPDGTAFYQPTNQFSYFFDLRPGVSLLATNYVDLDYECSSLINGATGAITVFLNNVPIQSRHIGYGLNQRGVWHLDLPKRMFKSGFNELKIVSRQSTGGEGPCRDIDNSGNWLRFGMGSKLHLERLDPPAYKLFTYPFPYLDTLSSNVVQSHWSISGGIKPSVIGEALSLAGDWGRREIIRPLNIHLSANGPRAGQNVVLSEGAGGGEGSLGSLRIAPGRAPGSSTLTIDGASDPGLHAARRTLSFPELVSQARGFRTGVDVDPVSDNRYPTTRLGSFSFTELGYPNITMRGAFGQHATLAIQRPVRCDLGRESFVNIRFRHAANLNPLRSILTIKINGLPVGSARLDDGNANGGVFTARIPISELTKNLWQIDLEAYHDLATVDCSQTYDAVAWTVVEGTSTFDLNTGLLGGRPYLEAFPYLVGKDGIAPAKIGVSLSSTPSDAELSVAATIAARASQINRHPFDWDVNLGGLPTTPDSALAIGYYDEASRFASIKDNLLIAPLGGDKFAINPKIRVLASSLTGGAFLQAIPSPGNKNGVLYVLLAANDAALNRFASLLSTPLKSISITGEVVIMTNDGQLTALSSIQPGEVGDTISKEQDRYSAPMMIIMGIVVLAIVIFFVWAGRQFVKRPAR